MSDIKWPPVEYIKEADEHKAEGAMSFVDWVQFFFRPRTIPFVCEFSARNPDHDIHDYPVSCGGDGHPDCFRTYTCHACGKEFCI